MLFPILVPQHMGDGSHLRLQQRLIRCYGSGEEKQVRELYLSSLEKRNQGRDVITVFSC